MISRSGIHAIKALSVLAELTNGQHTGAAEVAERIAAPRNYLGKLLKTLADNGLLESQKGKGGGFRLARRPAEVSLFEIVEPIERVSRWTGCFLGRRKCSDASPCPVHPQWGQIRDQYLQFLKETTLADLVEQQTVATR